MLTKTVKEADLIAKKVLREHVHRCCNAHLATCTAVQEYDMPVSGAANCCVNSVGVNQPQIPKIFFWGQGELQTKAREVSTCTQAMKREIGAHHLRHTIAVCRCPSTAAKDIGREIVDFFAVLVSNNRP